MSTIFYRTANNNKHDLDDFLRDLEGQVQNQDPAILGSRLINRAELRQIFPVSDMTIWRLEKQGRFPRHTTINGRNFWNFVEVLNARARLSEEG